MKNEARNIDEWMEHCFWQGADEICLIDNGSTDGSFEKAQRLSKKYNVKTLYYPEPKRQLQHYKNAMTELDIAGRFEWLIACDLDEFWYCPGSKKLSEQLSEIREHDLIYVNWSTFGTSGFKSHPSSLREELVMRRPKNDIFPRQKWALRLPAFMQTGKGFDLHTVSGIDSARVVSDTIRFKINHYKYQSLEFWNEVKMKRGDAYYTVNYRKSEELERADLECTLVDNELANLVKSART